MIGLLGKGPGDLFAQSRAEPRTGGATKAALYLALALGTAACGSTGQILTQEESLAKIPVSRSAGPGQSVMSGYDAGVIFANTCLVRGPNFDNYAYGLRVHDVTRNEVTGTFYHNTANLSVRVADGQCSLVFFSDASTDNVVSQLADGTLSIIAPVPRNISVTSRAAPSGDGRYYRMAIQAPVVIPEGARRGG